MTLASIHECLSRRPGPSATPIDEHGNRTPYYPEQFPACSQARQIARDYWFCDEMHVRGETDRARTYADLYCPEWQPVHQQRSLFGVPAPLPSLPKKEAHHAITAGL